jgi:hypothetical protein
MLFLLLLGLIPYCIGMIFDLQGQTVPTAA